MGYLSKLRESVGHDTIIMVGATAFVENSRGEILMQLRSDTKDWGLPGGSLEIGEKVEEAAAPQKEMWLTQVRSRLILQYLVRHSTLTSM